jgi:hypothetical protein
MRQPPAGPVPGVMIQGNRGIRRATVLPTNRLKRASVEAWGIPSVEKVRSLQQLRTRMKPLRGAAPRSLVSQQRLAWRSLLSGVQTIEAQIYLRVAWSPSQRAASGCLCAFPSLGRPEPDGIEASIQAGAAFRCFQSLPRPSPIAERASYVRAGSRTEAATARCRPTAPFQALAEGTSRPPPRSGHS